MDVLGNQSSSSSKIPAKTLPAFEFPVGPTEHTKFTRTPIQVFHLFFTMVVMEAITLKVEDLLLLKNDLGNALHSSRLVSFAATRLHLTARRKLRNSFQRTGERCIWDGNSFVSYPFSTQGPGTIVTVLFKP